MSFPRQYCTFHLAGRWFGLDILDVKEISAEKVITPIRQAHPEVKGYVNIRGQIHLVLDLRLMLGYPGADQHPNQKLVIFKPGIGEHFGVLVDAIDDVVTMNQSAWEAPPALAMDNRNSPHHTGQALIAGVGKLEKGLLTILDAKRFLSAIGN